MNLGELKEQVYNIIDETDYDEQIEQIVKNALNEAYVLLCAEDVRIARSYIPVINGVASLPTNMYKLIKCTPELNGKDKIVGSNVLTEKSGVLEVLYSTTRELLTLDSDEPDLHDLLQQAMVCYACYRYFEHRKKSEMSQVMFNNYSTLLYKFQENKFDNENNASTEFIRSEW